MWVLIASNAVIALGYGVVSPVLPQYARNFGVSISAATFVITAFALMRLCFAPASGLLIQRLGERRIYVSGLLIVRCPPGRARSPRPIGSCCCFGRWAASGRRCSSSPRWG